MKLWTIERHGCSRSAGEDRIGSPPRKQGSARLGPSVPLPSGTTLTEVKNVKSLSYTRQLRDFSDYGVRTAWNPTDFEDEGRMARGEIRLR